MASDESPEEFIARDRKKRARLALIVGGGAVVVIAGVVALVASMAGRVKTAEAPPDAMDVAVLQQTGREAYLERMREEMGAACEPRAARDVLKRMNKEDWFDEAIQLGTEWEARCGADEELRWAMYKAYEESERYGEAEALVGQLLAGKPDDVDYWWWRASVRKRQREMEGAAADYRQSMALSNLRDSNGVHVAGLVEVAPAIGRACDGVFAVRWYGHRNGGEMNGWARERMRSLAAFGGCTAEVGAGEGVLPLGGTVELMIGAAKATGVVDDHAPYVIVGTALAAQAGLDLSRALEVELLVDGALTTARVVRADISVGDELRATGVDVAVVATPPAGGVRLGLPFLWRWDVGYPVDELDEDDEEEEDAGAAPALTLRPIVDPTAL